MRPSSPASTICRQRPVRPPRRDSADVKAPSRWGRHLFHSEGLRRLLCWVIQLYIRFVYRTNRWSVEGGDIPVRLRQQGRPFILAFWHGRLLMIPMAWQRLAPMHMLISSHRDGRSMADAVTYFGVNSIAGSTRRGGMTALRIMLKQLAAGDCVGITPDGPRGPAMHASTGIVNAARLARVPIVPVTFATSGRWVLSTWDRFHLALPFGRGVFVWGEPIEVEPELDEAGVEHARLLVENRMNEMAEHADRRGEGHTGGRGPTTVLSPPSLVQISPVHPPAWAFFHRPPNGSTSRWGTEHIT